MTAEDCIRLGISYFLLPFISFFFFSILLCALFLYIFGAHCLQRFYFSKVRSTDNAFSFLERKKGVT